MDLIDILKAVDKGIGIVVPWVSGPLGDALRIVDIAIESATAFAGGGKDPVAEIQRIHDADPLLQEMKSEWDARIAAKPEGA